MNKQSHVSLVERLVAGERRAAARLISWAERNDPRVRSVLEAVYPKTGRSYRLGITGPPGAGKSSLINAIVQKYRARGERVAVVAVDPSSPFSGGAVLGDRVRMTGLAGDPGVFIRSMASRGSLGGLAEATMDALDLLDVAGYDRLIVETVGVGQLELDVILASDTVALVLVPESGDGVQAMKAGLMEVADVLVINKADRDGAAGLRKDLEFTFSLASREDGWHPPVVETVAVGDRGIDELIDALDRHQAHLGDDGRLGKKRAMVLKERVLSEVRRQLARTVDSQTEDRLEDLLERVGRRTLSPGAAARLLVEELRPQTDRGGSGGTES